MFPIHDLLLLLSVPGIGSQRIFKLLAHFSSPNEVLNASSKQLQQVESISAKLANAVLSQKNDINVKKHLKLIEQGELHILQFWEDRYPKKLKSLYDPPVLLFVKGDLQTLDSPSIAIVGTRAATVYGKQMAEMLGGALAEHKIVVVSGMARGVDTYAHQSTLKNNGRTVAVLGSGLDVIYPPENKSLFYNIARNGAVVSEFPFGTEPNPGNFPRRNRIISGLSIGTVVVEAGEKSGAMITAYTSLEQGRDVFAVPGKVTSGKSRGPHKLIREGAKLVETVDDILAEIPGYEKTKSKTKSMIENIQLSGDEKTIYEVLSDEPAHVDFLAEKLNKTTAEILSVLLALELKHCIKQLSGMRFIRMNS